MANHVETIQARVILSHTQESVKGFFSIFDSIMRTRGGGAPTDQEQDLLRASLVFSAAGLDSTLKELVKGSLKTLAAKDSMVRAEFETFVIRQLRGDPDESEGLLGHKFLANVLLSPSPNDMLLTQYVLHLTGTSLQSVDQLIKTAKALGIGAGFLIAQKASLNSIFLTRNRIIHELDIRFMGKRGKRQRNSRRRGDLERECRLLLDISGTLISEVELKL